MGYEDYLYAGASDKVLGLLNSGYQHVDLALTGTATEIYTFRETTATSSIVRVITVTYTDATKATLSTADRTA